MKRNLLILLTLLMLLPVGASARSTGYTCDHDWSEWHIYAPSCGYEGWKKRWCYNCNEEQTIYIPATGKHVWTEWETNREPDCLNTGEKERHCKECYTTEYKTIPRNSNGHSWGRWWGKKSATIFTAGLQERECYICGRKQSKKIPKLKATVRFSKKTYTMKRNYWLSPRIYYKIGDSVKTFKSSNKKVATVTKKGIIKAKKKGTTKITVITKAGAKATCKIKVK